MNRFRRLLVISLISVGLCAVTGCAEITGPSAAPAAAAESTGVAITGSLSAWESEFGVSSPAAPPPVVVQTQQQPIILSESTPVVAEQTCAGTTIGSAASLPPGTMATAVTICSAGSGYLRGSGYWGTVETRVVPAEAVPGFVRALSTPLPPFPADAACAAVGWLFPAIKVSGTDGITAWAEVPSDGCSPSEPVLQQLDDITTGVTPTIERTVLRTSEKVLLSGCTGAKPLYPTRASSGTAVMPALEAPAFSVCVYTSGVASDTALSASGTVDPAALAKLTADLTAEPPTGCDWPDGSSTDIGSFITLVPRPASPDPLTQQDPLPFVSIASTGCHVVIDDSWEIVGWIDDSTYSTLVASTG